jgi:hypothetical protein
MRYLLVLIIALTGCEAIRHDASVNRDIQHDCMLKTDDIELHCSSTGAIETGDTEEKAKVSK